MKPAPILKAKGLVLRGIEEKDTDYIIALRSDPDVYKYFFNPHKITVAEHTEWFRKQYVCDENRIDWMVVEKVSGRSVGVFGIKREAVDCAVAEVSYLLAPEFRGRGYASEALGCVMGFAAEKWSCTLCVAKIHVDNHASVKFAEKLGFIWLETHGSFAWYRKTL